MRILIFLVVLFISTQTLGQISSPNIEDYGKLPNISLMVVSPDAQRIAYRDVSTDKDLLIIRELKTKKLISAIDISNVNPNFAYFISNEKLILVATQNRYLNGYRGRHEVSAAFAFNLTTNKLHQLLIPGRGIYGGQTQLGRVIAISPDKKYAYMPAYKDLGSFNLYKVNLTKNKKPRIYQRGKKDTIDFFMDDQANVLARERYNNDTNIHQIESLIDGDWVKIFKEETSYRTKSFAGITPDFKSLVMLNKDKKHGRVAYFTMSLADGKISDATFSHKDKDVERLLTDINRVVHGVRYSGFTPTYEFFDNKLNARIRGINHAMPNNAFIVADYTPDWSSIILYMDGQNSSGDYVLYQNSTLSRLASIRAAITPETVNPITQYSFKARDGLIIPTLMTKPVNSKLEKLPAIILPHGGPESYDTISFDWMSQYFANQGYLVIQPQFRGSTGFGPEHTLAGRGQWGKAMQDDLTDAVKDLINKGFIDKDKICIVGSSYGGYAALAGAAFTPDLYQCAVSINGVADVEAMLKKEKINYGSDHWVVSYWQDLISNGDINKDHLKQISPINHIKNINIPILLIHGELDQIVPISQSEEMFDELEDADKKANFIELEKGDHYLSKGKNRMQALRKIDEFIKKHI
jgi:dipeptidyl aminopeptidase/acylaminoacyl peptidase